MLREFVTRRLLAASVLIGAYWVYEVPPVGAPGEVVAGTVVAMLLGFAYAAGAKVSYLWFWYVIDVARGERPLPL